MYLKKFLVQSVLLRDFRRSKKEDPNDSETKILRQFSASNTDGPQPYFVFNAAFTISALQTTGWTCFIVSCNNNNKCKVPSVNDKGPWLMLFVNNSSAPLTFYLCIKCLNLMEIFRKFIGVLLDGSLYCISLLSSNKLFIFLSSHNFNRLSNEIDDPVLDFLLGFCRIKLAQHVLP